RAARTGEDEEAVGVAVEHAVAVGFDTRLRPEEDLSTEAGDGVGDRRARETARRRTEHAVKRVHEDLDGVAAHRVARGLARLPRGGERVEQRRRDPGRPSEGGAVGSDEGVVPRLRLAQKSERVDLKRTDQARIEALEVEDEHVAVDAGRGVEDVTAGER